MKKPFDSIKDTITENENIQSSITNPIIKLMDDDIYNVLQKLVDSLVNNNGILGCYTLNDIFKSLGDIACCDLMNDVVALSAASYI